MASAMVFLFDTCTSKCAYCGHATSGKVMDGAQLLPYKNKETIDKFLAFFEARTSHEKKWLLMLLGGEPLLMPNLDYFIEKTAKAGNKTALYTSLNIGENHRSYKYLTTCDPENVDYIMASFHPEADQFEDKFFDMLLELKNHGHKVVFRFIAHPMRLHRMESLHEKCRDIDVCFSPYAYCSANYPLGYTAGDKDIIKSFSTNLSQLIQLENGLKVDRLQCDAGSELLYVNARDGKIFPCPNVYKRAIGNVYDNYLEVKKEGQGCYDKTARCFCDVNFQQTHVKGADDSGMFALEKRGYVKPQGTDKFEASLRREGHEFHNQHFHNTLGENSDDDRLILSKAEVAERYQEHKNSGARGNRNIFHEKLLVD